MSGISSPSKNYQRGYLPSKIQQFIEATSETKAIILLESYIRDGLAAELQDVLGLSGNEIRDKENRDRVAEMTKAKDEALSGLDALVATVRQNITTQHLTSTDLELNDLCPFIPRFTTAQTR